MSLHPYLFFDGNCEEAFRSYAEILGGSIGAMMTYAEAPPAESDVPADQKHKVMHAYLKFGDEALLGSDSPPGHYETMKGVYVSLAVADPGEAERIFNALADGGEVHRPLEETFWARSFGMLADRYGIRWMINCNKPGVGD